MAHEHIVYMMLMDAATIERDRDTLLKYAPFLEELAIRDDHQPYLGVSLRAQGIANMLSKDFEQAEVLLHQALKIFEHLEMPWQRARTLSELAEVAQLDGADNKSQEMYGEALEEFERMDAKPDVLRIKELQEKRIG